MPWNPDVYNQFKAERYAPFYDLLNLIKPTIGMEIIDLGCGTGELTRKLADALPASHTTGIDSSEEMLEKAAAFAREGVHFELQTIEETLSTSDKYDLVFSNAALQWIPDHKELMQQIIYLLKSNGQLAIQVPSNHNHHSHMAIRATAEKEPFRSALKGWNRISPVLSIEEYAQIFFDNGGHDITVFEKVYPHVLENARAVVEWTSGTALVPYMEKLPEDLRNAFLAEYTSILEKSMPGSPVLYPFKRTLMTAIF